MPSRQNTPITVGLGRELRHVVCRSCRVAHATGPGNYIGQMLGELIAPFTHSILILPCRPRLLCWTSKTLLLSAQNLENHAMTLLPTNSIFGCVCQVATSRLLVFAPSFLGAIIQVNWLLTYAAAGQSLVCSYKLDRSASSSYKTYRNVSSVRWRHTEQERRNVRLTDRARTNSVGCSPLAGCSLGRATHRSPQAGQVGPTQPT